MKKIVLTIFSGCLFSNCGFDEKSREKLLHADKIDQDLTVEVFNVFGQGAWGADLYGYWLTDSASFRTFIGTCDFQNNRIGVDRNGDSVIIGKYDGDGHELSKDTISLLKLSSTRNYEK